MEGKTAKEWHKVVFADPLVKSDGALIAQIINGKFLPLLVEASVAAQDENGIWHRVKDASS